MQGMQGGNSMQQQQMMMMQQQQMLLMQQNMMMGGGMNPMNPGIMGAGMPGMNMNPTMNPNSSMDQSNIFANSALTNMIN